MYREEVTGVVRKTVVMPKVGELHALGWAIDHVMSAPNVRARTQEQIAEVAGLGGYNADRRLVGTYMRNWPYDPKKPDRNGKPRSNPPFAFIWSLIRGGNLTNEQARELTDAWLEIQPEEERKSLKKLSSILSEHSATLEAWQDMMDLEKDRASDEGEVGGRNAGGNSRS